MYCTVFLFTQDSWHALAQCPDMLFVLCADRHVQDCSLIGPTVASTRPRFARTAPDRWSGSTS
jgi:hypothetical protein